MFFFINPNYFTIGTKEYIAESDRTFDMPFNDLATNRKLWNLFNLISLKRYTSKEDEIRFKAFYLASFSNKDYEQARDYLDNNGIIRILIVGESLLSKFLQIVNSKN